MREVDQASVEAEDLYKIMTSEPEIQEKEDAVDLELKEGNIEFEKVSFSHQCTEGSADDCDPTKLLLDNFSLKIKAGTSNAIVGPSGFGKTTMFNLLMRLHDPTEGCIKIDGQDVKDLTFDSFRKHVSVVPQNGLLFNDSILYNLKYSNPDATLEEVIEVAKKCRIHEKIMRMEHGYDTQVGDLGAMLSGGERQRVLIARGLLKKDASIFLFDEATSNLDPHTEKVITKELQELLKGKTVVYCAHRLSSITSVDKIHVLNEGRVVEEGSHEELMRGGAIKGEVYRGMWKNFLKEQDETTS